MPADVRALVIGVTLVLLGYASAMGVVALLTRTANQMRRLRRRSARVSAMHVGPVMRWPSAAIGKALAMITVWSPVGAFALCNSNWHATSLNLTPTMRAPIRTGAHRHALRLAGATPVRVAQESDGSWQYLVDGIPDVVRGVG